MKILPTTADEADSALSGDLVTVTDLGNVKAELTQPEPKSAEERAAEEKAAAKKAKFTQENKGRRSAMLDQSTNTYKVERVLARKVDPAAGVDAASELN